jgi:hypothetical protein
LAERITPNVADGAFLVNIIVNMRQRVPTLVFGGEPAVFGRARLFL